MSKFFDELMESVQQMNEILRGEREPSREFHVDALQTKKIRKTHHRLIPERGNDQKP
jgi:putative transcriptional regulator